MKRQLVTHNAVRERIAKQYGAPTYKQYQDSAEQWNEWKRQAVSLPLSDIRRHASVATSNRHQCHDCFCCAALEVFAAIVSDSEIGRMKTV